MTLVLDLLRRVLEFLGWQPDQALFLETRMLSGSIVRTVRTCIPSAILPRTCFQQLHAVIRKCQVKVVSICQKKEYGSTRSVVRRLGTILSLEPYPRPYIKLVQDPGPLGNDEQSMAPILVAPSLADVLWVANDEEQAFTRLREEIERWLTVPLKDPFKSSQLKQSLKFGHLYYISIGQRNSTSYWTELWRKKSAGYSNLHPSIDSVQNVPKNSTQKDSLVDQTALQKISALEDELTFLRGQIAAIVSAQTLGSILPQGFKTFSIPDGFYPVPAMTSTPLSVSHNHFAIPSPPPLPSGVPSGVDASSSAVELMKQHRAVKNSGSSAADSADHQKTKNIPTMMDVLKDLNKVQLRAIERSPGGTPVSRPRKRQSSDWDPVALLTHALKQKFAHRNDEGDDSLDKENRSFDSSPFSSPEIPLVGRCSLKPNMKSSIIRTDEVKLVSTWKVRAQI